MTTATAPLALLEEKITKQRRLPDPPRRRELRLSARIPYADIAAVCGVSTTTVANWEAGRKNPTGDHLDAYLEVLRLLESA